MVSLKLSQPGLFIFHVSVFFSVRSCGDRGGWELNAEPPTKRSPTQSSITLPISGCVTTRDSVNTISLCQDFFPGFQVPQNAGQHGQNHACFLGASLTRRSR